MFYFTRQLFKNPFVAIFFFILFPITITLDIATLPFQLLFSFIGSLLQISIVDTKDLVIVSGSEEHGTRHLLVTDKNNIPGNFNPLNGTPLEIKEYKINSGTDIWGHKYITVVDKNKQKLTYRCISSDSGIDHYEESRNREEEQALSDPNLGLKNDDIRTWQQQNETFGRGHKDVLILLAQQGIKGSGAMNVINGLNEYQAAALSRLYDSGLRSEHLRSWQKPKYGHFGREHVEALVFLAAQGITGQQAINEINKLDDYQAEALTKLYQSGLRGTHLRLWQEPRFGSFRKEHVKALQSLATRGVTGQAAVNEINGLDEDQLKQKFNNQGTYTGTFWNTNEVNRHTVHHNNSNVEESPRYTS